LEEDYELNEDYLIEITSMQNVYKYVRSRIDRILNIIDSDPSIFNEIPEQNLNVIRAMIITKL